METICERSIKWNFVFSLDIVREILETRAEIYRVMGEEDAKEMGLDSEEEEIPKQSDKEPTQEAESEGVTNGTEESK
jgi:hypothetical protein